MSRHRFYTLNGKVYEPCPPEVAQAQWEDLSQLVLLASTISEEVSVFTIFLGIDHRTDQGGPPILFETLVVGGRWDGCYERYTSYETAETRHHQIVSEVHVTLGQDENRSE